MQVGTSFGRKTASKEPRSHVTNTGAECDIYTNQRDCTRPCCARLGATSASGTSRLSGGEARGDGWLGCAKKGCGIVSEGEPEVLIESDGRVLFDGPVIRVCLSGFLVRCFTVSCDKPLTERRGISLGRAKNEGW